MKAWIVKLLIWSLVCLTIWGIVQTQLIRPMRPVAFERNPEGIMGTSCHLVVVHPMRQSTEARSMLTKAEFRLRYIESLASNWIEDSEISQLNRSAGGTHTPLSRVNHELLVAAREAWEQTQGTFDITCRPLIELWKAAGKSGTMPSPESINTAREQSHWNHWVLLSNGSVRKRTDTTRVDLGGIAKGYAIDEAAKAMMDLGARGGMVDVGGDLVVFGESSHPDGLWRIDIRNPSGVGILGTLTIPGGHGVCTSGDYARFVEIEGRRFSHIINPATGYPADKVPSVTVVAPDAITADVWATALSILGQNGFPFLPEGVHAMLIWREAEDYSQHIQTSPGFPELSPVH